MCVFFKKWKVFLVFLLSRVFIYFVIYCNLYLFYFNIFLESQFFAKGVHYSVYLKGGVLEVNN